MNKTKRLQKIISIIFLLLAGIWTVHYVSQNFEDFKDIKLVSPIDLGIMMGLFLLGLGLRGYFMKIIIKSFGVNLKFKQWFGLNALNNFGNYIMPFGGFGLRAIYLKSFHNFPYTYFVTTITGTYILQFICFSSLGLLSLALMYWETQYYHFILTALFVSTIIGCFLFVGIFPRLPEFKFKFARYLNKMLAGLEQLKQNKSLLISLCIILLLRGLIHAYTFYFAFQAFDYPIRFSQALMIATLTIFTIILSFTPASLGLQEGAIVLSSKLFGFSIANGLLVAGLYRISATLCVFPLGLYFSQTLMNQPLMKENASKT